MQDFSCPLISGYACLLSILVPIRQSARPHQETLIPPPLRDIKVPSDAPENDSLTYVNETLHQHNIQNRRIVVEGIASISREEFTLRLLRLIWARPQPQLGPLSPRFYLSSPPLHPPPHPTTHYPAQHHTPHHGERQQRSIREHSSRIQLYGSHLHHAYGLQN